MANKEQLAILKKGADAWNMWRQENQTVDIDLSGAKFSETNLIAANLINANLSKAELKGTDLREADLMGANLREADLRGADLSEVDIRGAHLSGADISQANLSNADLRGVDLIRADLSRANLSSADLSRANLSSADLSSADLNSANFSGANLSRANLNRGTLVNAFLRNADLTKTNLCGAKFWQANLNKANLSGADLEEARFAGTIFGDAHLSEAFGLENVRHDAPSQVSIDMLENSKGKIPETFLRGCGLRDWEIESAKLYNPDLSNEETNNIVYRIYDLRATQAIQINPLFISYSHGDTVFVDKMEAALTKKGVRFWRDIHDMVAGRMEKQVDRAIRQNPTFLLVLSEHSISSDWVEHEVRMAREFEKELGRDVLCPVALDESWKSSKWPERMMEQVTEYNILDFSLWKDNVAFDKKFAKLLKGLDLFYKKPKR